MIDLRKRTAFLLIEHKRVFNQNPAKRDLMDHIKALQERVDTLEKIIKENELCQQHLKMQKLAIKLGA